MTPGLPLLLCLVVATTSCGHPTYGRKPPAAAPTDTLNGEPRSHAPPNVPKQPVRDEPNTPPPPR
jgi:hypothetical protein